MVSHENLKMILLFAADPPKLIASNATVATIPLKSFILSVEWKGCAGVGVIRTEGANIWSIIVHIIL